MPVDLDALARMQSAAEEGDPDTSDDDFAYALIRAFPEILAELRAARVDNEQLRTCLKAIKRYRVHEVAKDAFAYDRLVAEYRDAASKGLRLSDAVWKVP